MATTVTPPAPALSRPQIDRRFEHPFFLIMSFMMLATVYFGFARTYYLAGMLRAPLPSLIIHIHGAAFTLWILLYVTQTSLVFAKRTDVHRRLGMAGFVLACIMVCLGVMAGTDSLVRASMPIPGRDPKMFYIVPLTDMLLFATFVYVAFRNRFDSPAHKRAVYLATSCLTIAAIARLPFAFSLRKSPIDGALTDIFLVALIAYDLWSTRKIHRVTLWAGAFMVLIQQIRIPIGKTALWHVFATWVQTHAR